MFVFFAIMKSKLLKFTILLNIIFVICEASGESFAQDVRVQPISLEHDFISVEEDTGDSGSELNKEESNEDASVSPVSEKSEETETSENPENNIETTTEQVIESTTKDDSGERNCTKDQSLFRKQDLIMIINYVSNFEFNILPNITDAYHDTAIRARDVLTREFNDFNEKLKERPNHLIHILDDMGVTRQTKIVPLVETATATLEEFPAVEADFNRLRNKTTKMLNELERYKKICELNNCDRISPRSSFAFETNSAKASYPDDSFVCSTIEEVHSTITKRLLAFEEEEIERIKKFIDVNDEPLEKAIAMLKVHLREAAVSQFGITMYEILNLNDDHIHFVSELADFNSKSHTSALRKKNMNIEYKHITLEQQITKYRIDCLNCGQRLRRRRLAADETDVDNENTERVSDNEDINILDQLINVKIEEIEKLVHTNIENIFKELNDTVNDSQLLEKTIAQLKPIQESISNRTLVEKQALETLMKSVSKEAREHAQEVQEEATSLIDSINKALAFFQKKN